MGTNPSLHSLSLSLTVLCLFLVTGEDTLSVLPLPIHLFFLTLQLCLRERERERPRESINYCLSYKQQRKAFNSQQIAVNSGSWTLHDGHINDCTVMHEGERYGTVLSYNNNTHAGHLGSVFGEECVCVLVTLSVRDD